MVALKAGIVLAGQVGDRCGEMHGRLVLTKVYIPKYIVEFLPRLMEEVD